tara:strand:+ start:1769 stop:2005 length:237 start_codon:yes stop_codon:yes gene_type:complete
MRLFDREHGTYATPKNAERKLKNEIAKNGDSIEDYHWHIGVTSEGRFYPVATHCMPRAGSGLTRGGHLWLAHHGVAVC